nr:MAG TPA: helix-turn-helix domain protein [Caudoviricetes sp.]
MSYALSFKAGKCFVGSSADKAVLRCLCDYANDDGSSCRPATSTISAETELNKKTVYKSLSSLSQAGWIEVSSLNGRQNFYTINVTKIEEAFIETTAEKRQTSTKNGTTTNFGTGTKNGLQPVPNLVHNSVNTQSIINTSKDVYVDRSEKGSTDSQKNAPIENDEFTLTEPGEKELTPAQKAMKVSKRCPQEKIIELYNTCLPMLKPVRIWKSAARVNNLAARWREMALDQGFQSEAEGLDFFKRFFEFVGRSRFLTGQVKQKDGRVFRADLEWITQANNFEKICDRKYHDR